ncbi:hypothetical protein [Actinacidiphila yanglinensis]|uniref:hypothetical protein n=1 Tax=Actinacidiphila yanglinensis TaxID=310779 RepID=UPI0011AFE346|nr:hypothetical protein [Actinacidiphila yanglinensis]
MLVGILDMSSAEMGDPVLSAAKAGAAIPAAITEPASTAATFEYFTCHPFLSRKPAARPWEVEQPWNAVGRRSPAPCTTTAPIDRKRKQKDSKDNHSYVRNLGAVLLLITFQ